MELGPHIRQARERAGISQMQLADLMTRAGYPTHQTAISKFESGTYEPRFSEVVALCAIIGADLAAIVSMATDEGQDALELRSARAEVIIAEQAVTRASEALTAARRNLAAAKAEHQDRQQQLRDLERRLRRSDSLARAEQAARELTEGKE
ncbi:MAG: helix-turn-helix domain-containing protein, partial [Actinobacteria bacterium]|nr:helix-turn-helix domain-containing protein [Actinomycetota bacterium]